MGGDLQEAHEVVLSLINRVIPECEPASDFHSVNLVRG